MLTLVVVFDGDALFITLAAEVAILDSTWLTRRFWPDCGACCWRLRGDGLVIVAWGLYAAMLLLAAFRVRIPRLVRGAVATLLIVVGKPFLVDLAEVDVVWRVPLFLGFGGLFLALSYYLRSLWRLDSRVGEGCP